MHTVLSANVAHAFYCILYKYDPFTIHTTSTTSAPLVLDALRRRREKKTKHTHTIQIERYSIVVAYVLKSRVLVLYSCLRFEKYTKRLCNSLKKSFYVKVCLIRGKFPFIIWDKRLNSYTNWKCDDDDDDDDNMMLMNKKRNRKNYIHIPREQY